MIQIVIPKDIREYKEKIVLGLTCRQAVTIGLALGIGVPLHLFGKQFINEDILPFIIVLIGVPIVACGFVTVNGMPFELFLKSAIIKFLKFPVKRIYKSDNKWRRDLKDMYPEKTLDKKEKKLQEEASFEKLFLCLEAEENGEELRMKDIKNSDLVTVKIKEKVEKAKKEAADKKKSSKESKFDKLKAAADEIAAKQEADPEYVPDKKEGAMLRKYNNEVLKRRKEVVRDGVKEIKKKNDGMLKRKKAKTFIPKSAQDTLPYITDFDNGLFEVEEGVYSKCYRLKDVNFTNIKEEEQEQIFVRWGEFLNFFSEDIYLSITIDNRIVSESEMLENVHYHMRNDDFDVHRKEYNHVMDIAVAKSKKNIRQEKMFTVSMKADSPFEAEMKFLRMENAIQKNLTPIGSNARLMSTTERLELLHDKFRKGREGTFRLNYNFLEKQGLSSKDYVAPSSFSGMDKKDYFKIDDGFYRCLYISNLPASMSTDFIQEFVDVDFPLMTTVCIEPIASDKTLKMVGRNYASMKNDEIKYEKRAAKSGYSKAFLPPNLERSIEQAAELMDFIQNKSQKMFFVTLACMVYGKTKEELEENCGIVMSVARKFTCQMSSFDFQQEEAMKITFPMGISPRGKLFVDKTMTTEAASLFLPFNSTELYHKNGFYYGINQVSNNIILCDRTQFKTPSGFVLGSAGSGKSFAVKREIFNVLFRDDETSVIVIDPEAEYVDFCEIFMGVPITVSPGSDVHINPMDMSENYGLDVTDDVMTTPLEVKKKKALVKKSDYIMSIVQSMMQDANGYVSITPAQKTIIDRAVQNSYHEYLSHGFDTAYLPTLKDLYNEIQSMRLTAEGAAEIADGIDYYINGSMGVFADYSNVDYNNRFVVFNIKELGEQLRQIALLIILDFIWDKMSTNFAEGRRTYTYADEIHVLFRNDFAAQYLRQLYKRGRKFGLVITGITQDCEDLLSNSVARGMISNSDFVLMLSQKSENLKALADMLKLSEDEQRYVTQSAPGSGLLFAEQVVVPFEDDFPTTSYLYKLISTKFGEERNIDDIRKYVAQLIENNGKGDADMEFTDELIKTNIVKEESKREDLEAV